MQVGYVVCHESQQPGLWNSEPAAKIIFQAHLAPSSPKERHTSRGGNSNRGVYWR